MYIYMYKEDLALNNLQWLTCHKTQPNQSKQNKNEKTSRKLKMIQFRIQTNQD